MIGDAQSAGGGGADGRLGIALVFGVGAVFLYYLAFSLFGRAILEERRLAHHGQIVPGVVKRASIRRGTRGVTGLEVDYQFQASGDTTLDGKTIVTYGPGSRPSMIPQQGAPLAILWVDDTLHKAL